jgi:hypothetical protein
MRLDQFADEGIARRYDYPDRTVFVTDLGPAAEPAVDVVDGTVIVVADDGEQREFDLPEGEVRAFNRNGIVMVEVRQ